MASRCWRRDSRFVLTPWVLVVRRKSFIVAFAHLAICSCLVIVLHLIIARVSNVIVAMLCVYHQVQGERALVRSKRKSRNAAPSEVAWQIRNPDVIEDGAVGGAAGAVAEPWIDIVELTVLAPPATDMLSRVTGVLRRVGKKNAGAAATKNAEIEMPQRVGAGGGGGGEADNANPMRQAQELDGSASEDEDADAGGAAGAS